MVARLAAALAVLLAVAGCAASGHGAPAASSPARGSSPALVSSPPPVSSPAPASSPGPVSSPPVLGEAGCHPPSPLSASSIGVGPQVQGTGHGAQLWGLLMFAHVGPARVGDQEKIVWRMTGSGPLTLTAVSPGGVRHRPVWGPEAHGGSNWNKPGQEWGAGYVFTTPGCWDLHAGRGGAYADVWIRVVKR
jgi:hypothetical protein